MQLLRRRLAEIETKKCTSHAVQVTTVGWLEKLVLNTMRVIDTNLFFLSTTVKCLSKQDKMIPVRTTLQTATEN